MKTVMRIFFWSLLAFQAWNFVRPPHTVRIDIWCGLCLLLNASIVYDFEKGDR